MSLLDNVGSYGSSGSAFGTVIPGVGTIIGGTVGSVIGVFTSLFGNSQDTANNQFIDQLVASAQSLGFSGFTHEDVVHLMPGGWGNNYTYAKQIFQDYLNLANSHPANTNLVPYFAFGGSYTPGHEILYNPPVNQTSIGGGTSINTSQTSTNTAGFGTIGIILIIGIGFFIFFGLAKTGKL